MAIQSPSGDSDPVVRFDSVNLFKQEWEARIPFPLGADSSGFLGLTKHGTVFYWPWWDMYTEGDRLKCDKGLVTTVSEITGVKIPSPLVVARLSGGVFPKRLIEARMCGKRYVIFFDSNDKKPPSLLAMVKPFVHPGHHLGLATLGARMMWIDATGGGTARGHRELWLNILNGVTSPADLSLLEQPTGGDSD